MKYEQISTGSQYPYPDHSIDPKLKGREWCMQYARSAFSDWSFAYPKGVFANNGGDYEKFKMYALGKQPVTPYKKWLGVDAQTDNTWLSVDWTVRSIISPYRDKAISRMMEKDFSIIATPIDITAKSDLQDYYAEMKAKLAVRKLMQQVNEELANHPLISLQSGEPMDNEELEMRAELGEQFNRSKDAELAIAVGFYENNYKNFRRSLYEDLFDLGVSGYKEWLGEDNKAKFRKVNPECVVTSYARKGDFSDIVHAGELIDVALVDLALVTDKEGNRMFDEKLLQEFAASIAGKWGNPTVVGGSMGWFKPYDKFKCKVLDLCFYSYDDHVYRYAKDENNNPDFRKADYNRGKKSDKYMRKTIKTLYKVKWIVGTDHCYDWGIMDDQPRAVDPKKKAEVKLPYKFFAYNFYEMKAQGFMSRLIPYLDEYQLTTLKIQNFKNRAVPSGWWIDLDALENVALNKGGANMQPKELLQMFFDTGVLVGRSKDEMGNPQSPNWKPVIPIENTAASELAMFYQDIINTITAIERITGYNDVTMGEANPKTLVPGYEIANAATNQALFPMVFAEQDLSKRLASDVLMRMQQGVKKGGISGYAPALNTNLLQFIQISPDICLRDYGIELEEKTSDDQKMWLLQQMQNDIANGYLDTSDAVLLVNTKNAKQAQMIWAYKVKKAKETQAAQKLKELQAQNDGAIQAAQIAQQSVMQVKQLEIQAELQKEEMRINGELAKEKMRIEAQIQTELIKQQSNQAVANNSSQAKVYAADSAAEAKIISTQIANEGAVIKQHVANQKPKSESKEK